MLDRLPRLAFSLSLAAALTSPDLASQDPAKAPAQQTAGCIAPADSELWLRIRGIASMDTKLRNHPARMAVQGLIGAEGPLGTALGSLLAQWHRLGESYGLSAKLSNALLGRDARIAVFGSRAKRGFACAFSLGEHRAVLQSTLESLPLVERSREARWIHTGVLGVPRCVARLAGDWLVIASSLETSQRASESLSGTGDHKSLCDDPAFARIESDRDTWLTLFARGWALDALRATKTMPSWWQRIGASATAVSLNSRMTGSVIEDKWTAHYPSNKSQWLGARQPDSSLRRLVPLGSRTWWMARFDFKALIPQLKARGTTLPGLGKLEILGADLAALEGFGDGLDALSSVFEGSCLLTKTPTAKGWAIALLSSDARRTAKLMQGIGREIAIPGGKDQGIHRFAVDRGGSKLHVLLCDDIVCASGNEAAALELLENYLSKNVDKSVAEQLEQAPPRAALLGFDGITVNESSSPGRRAAEGLCDSLRFEAIRDESHVTLTARGTTGQLATAIAVAAEAIPGWHAARQTSRLEQLTRLADQIHAAQEKAIAAALVDTDQDGQGEAAALSRLVDAKLLSHEESALHGTGNILEGLGYRWTILNPADSDTAEQRWLVLAWPIRAGASGKYSLAVSQDASLTIRDWIPGLDPQTGPSQAQLFGDRKFGEFITAWTEKRAPRLKRGTPIDSKWTARTLAAEIRKALEAKNAQALLALLELSDETMRAHVVRGLGELGDPAALPSIARVAREDTQALVRRTAAWALTRYRGIQAKTSLVGLLQDNDARTRLHAATGLLGSRAAGATKALVKSIHTFTKDEEGERSQAVLALHDQGDPSVLTELVTTGDGSARFAEAMRYCFQRLSPKLEAEQEVKLLVQALSSPIESLRSYAIERIAVAQHKSALPALTARMEKEGPKLQPKIQAVIEELQPSAAKSPVDGWIREAKLAYWKFMKQPTEVKAVVALSPTILLVLMAFFWMRRRRRRSRAPATHTHAPAAPGTSLGLIGRGSSDSGAEEAQEYEEAAR